ncbi:MAG: GtrA family protein [Clostridia bacterium]|nr:GtrA family protein [Clostridia bacterium]
MLYLVFGILTTAVNLIVFMLCNKTFKDINFSEVPFLSIIFLGKPYLLSNVIAWIVAVTFAFFTNKIIVFKSKSFEHHLFLKEIASFFGARVFSLIVEQLGLMLLVDTLLQKELVSKIIISVVVVLLNYFFSKLLIFKKSPN